MTILPSLSRIPLDSTEWRVDAEEHRFGRHLGEGLYLRNGSATLDGADFTDGMLEVALALGRERAFTGLAWRVVDGDNFESFFLRPHQSGNPDATQYTPVFNGISAWQLYRGERYTVPLTIPAHEWFTVRIAVTAATAEIFVRDLDRPALVVRELKRPIEQGGVGLTTGEAPSWFSEFAYVAVEPSEPETTAQHRADSVVPAWEVSDAFDEEAVAGAHVLGERLVAGRRWSMLVAEPGGLADLARVNGVRDGRDTVLARTTLHAAHAGTRRVDLGFSDRARVYLNGRLVFLGDDPYRSRDYRFLGSIGWWDSLWLPLDEGANELVVAVTEEFGGWGLQARFPAADGLSFH